MDIITFIHYICNLAHIFLLLVGTQASMVLCTVSLVVRTTISLPPAEVF